MPRIELERIEEIEDPRSGRYASFAESSMEAFDRVAFAERALSLVRPVSTTVAICEGGQRVRVEAGRQWGAGTGQRWAILSVPRNASRRAIASAILEIGVARSRPWALDILVNGCEGP